MAEGDGSSGHSTAEPGASHDIFLSYASRDAAFAAALCRDLESSGFTCWMAPRDVPPGAQYADAIVRAINAAKALLVVLSEGAVASSHVGKEIERASSKGRPVIALRVDMTPLTPALEYFLSESQWIEAPAGLDSALPKLREAMRRVLSLPPQPAAAGSSAFAPFPPHGSESRPARGDRRRLAALPLAAWIVGALAFVAIAAVAALWMSRRGSPQPATASAAVPSPPATSGGAPPTASAGFSPPPHSVAVLPFVNMSGDKEQDYFTDGLSEELLNSLVTIRGLQVAARTSSFSFKATTADTAEIARKLNVGAILEGSVRKDRTHVRITAQLINAVTGFHLWSKTYDRDLKDVLKLQTDVATEVAKALQGALMGDESARVDTGKTQNPQAFDAYLRGEKGRRMPSSKENDLATIAAYDEAIRLDPQFAKAYIGKSYILVDLSSYVPATEVPGLLDQALAVAKRAVAIAPDMGLAHAAYGTALAVRFDFMAAPAEFDRALALAPGDAAVLSVSSRYLSNIGRSEAALASIRRAVELDPLNPNMHARLAITLADARRFPESIAALDRAIGVAPGTPIDLITVRGQMRIAVGQYAAALEDCSTPPLDWSSRVCLAIVLDKLHRPAEARAAFEALMASVGDTAAYQYAEIHAQWGKTPQALDWLETAYRLRDPGLESIKNDVFLDPLRGERRFQQVVNNLKFPQ